METVKFGNIKHTSTSLISSFEYDILLSDSVDEYFSQLEFDFGKSCYPKSKSCKGQCQGMGWCYSCEEYMNGCLMEDHYEELMG